MEIMKKNKELINKLVTADSNGSPIYIKSPVPEKMSNDFLMTKSIISDKIISFTEEDRNKSIKEKEDKNPKQTINPESLIINNSNVNINTNKKEEKREEKINTINLEDNKIITSIKPIKVTENVYYFNK
jgi:hypothetical protein